MSDDKSHRSNRPTSIALLWDIDGTLLHGAKAAVEAWWLAAKAEFDFDMNWRLLDASGSTDGMIAAQICDQAEEGEAASERLITRYLQELPARLEKHPARTLRNVEAVLSHVAEDPGYFNLFLTGNLRVAARAKLVSCGLGHFAWEGAFSEQGRERNEVAAAAKNLAVEARGESVPIVVIGDTPRDIKAARAIGAYALIIATGAFSMDALAALDPDCLLECLPEPEEFAGVIGEMFSMAVGNEPYGPSP